MENYESMGKFYKKGYGVDEYYHQQLHDINCIPMINKLAFCLSHFTILDKIIMFE